MLSNPSVRQAVGLALGSAAAAGASLGFTNNAVAADAQASDATGLEEVVITGSHIRRVDAETASPVYVIDQSAIQESGITTVGDLVQRIPSISGAATNPNVNNGGGFGESYIELRGLSPERTLILLDGRRVGIVGETKNATDVNQIPINLIERVEVLKEGAGAVYGSDAIAGVVNFITRKSTDGIEIHGDYGRTTRNDGPHHSVDVIFGSSTDKASFQVGGTYMKQEAVFAGARDYSKFALYLYGGTSGIVKSGSSRTPNGRIFLPKGSALAKQFGCGSVTRIGTVNGPLGSPTPSGGSLSDYRCFTGPDHFNYQPYNLLTTNLERANAFSKLSYDLNEYATAYASFIYNHTHSANEEAPLPFDSPVDDIVISKNNIYNPFGIDFGGLTTGDPAALWRLSGLSDRRFVANSDSQVLNAGLKGKIGATGWNYDFNASYSRLEQIQTQNGYFVKSKFQNALGPSFIDPATGQPTCGTLGNPIAACTPLNIFNIFAPGQQAILNNLAADVVNQNTYRYANVSLNVDGKIVDLPAGALQASVGFAYNSQENNFLADSLAIASPPLYLQCGVSNEACTGDTGGKYSSKEVYAEFFVPILKDLPGVHSLNVDAGIRESKYSIDSLGSATKAEFKLEYRPIADLLVRGTYSQVFRVPTINDLFTSPANTSVTFNDPCQGLTQAKLTANPNLALACKGVVPDGTFKEPNGQITGLNEGNPNLKPETGNVKTFGIVYDPRFVPGLSIDIDYWQYELKDLITLLDSNYSIGQCVANGNPTFCNLVTRIQSGAQQGQILVFQNPTFNLGSLKTDGIDFGVKYAMKATRIGSFQFGLDITKTNSYLNKPSPQAVAQEIVGTYSKQFGNYARYRALGSIGWAYQNADALLTARYIGSEVVKNPSVSGVLADLTTPYPDLPVPSFTYLDLTLGYTFPTKTKIQLGVRNLTDKQPPVLYQNNVTNADTDVFTYDTLGRQWWVGFTQKL